MDMQAEAAQSKSDDLAGEYVYERVGFDARSLELLAGGKIGRGAAAAELTWSAMLVQGIWELSISGRFGLICRLFQSEEGVFRGHWLRFEQMPIALTAVRPAGYRASQQSDVPRLNRITGIRQRSAILEQLRHGDVSVSQIIFGCLRAEKLLCKDGRVEGTAASGERWELDGMELVLQTPQQDVARYGICDNPRELHGRWVQGDQPLSKLLMPGDPVATVSPESVCIVIGSFEQPDWTIANARACRLLNPGCQVLVFDNCSNPSVVANLKAAAAEYGFQVQVSDRRFSHYPGDVEVLKAGFTFARECGASYLARCNQRTIQTRPHWATEVATRLAADDAAVAYQCYWGEPHKIRTEMLAFNARRWEKFSASLAYGKLAAQNVEGTLFENWFYRLIWELFPWQHTTLDWFSRSRGRESEFTVSYYGGTSANAATGAVERLSQQFSPRPADMSRLAELYARARTNRSDIYEHVPTLRLLASQCNRIVEFGVRWGVSTAALLAGIVDRPGARLIAYDIERYVEVDELVAAGGDAFTFVQNDSRQVELGQTDLLFIDTFHSGDHLWEELTRHEARVCRWLVLHDTTTFGERGENGGPGLLSALQRFLSEYPDWSIVAQYENNNGLTVLQRISSSRSARC